MSGIGTSISVLFFRKARIYSAAQSVAGSQWDILRLDSGGGVHAIVAFNEPILTPVVEAV